MPSLWGVIVIQDSKRYNVSKCFLECNGCVKQNCILSKSLPGSINLLLSQRNQHLESVFSLHWVKDGQGQKLSLYMVLLRRCHLRKFSALFQIVNMSGLAPPATFTNPKCDYVCSLCSCPHVCTPTLATFTHAMHLSKFGDIMAVFRGGGR